MRQSSCTRGVGAWLVLVMAGMGFALPLGADPGSADRPNILIAFADDWGWPHAGAYGDAVVQTPHFDRVANEGILFTRSFVSSPSCTPSRGALLTGQDFWRLEEGANLWSTLPAKFPVYPNLLAEAGYFVGHTGKGWGPGRLGPGNRDQNPAGPGFSNFNAFLDERPEDTPFCFWFGGHDPHRGYNPDLKEKMGIDPSEVEVPPIFPDVEAVRRDIADYYAEVQRFDRDIGRLLKRLAEMGELDETLVVISGDHGMPFPRYKTQLYDSGARVPLAVRWPEGVEGGRVVTDLVSLTDLAPTFLEAAGVSIPEQMTGRSLMPLFTSDKTGQVSETREMVFFGRERHVPAQAGSNRGGYPSRAIRTERYLYIHNFAPARWPSGTPDYQNAFQDNAWLADCDNGPTKFYMWAHRDEPGVEELYDLAFAKRPAEELYDVKRDPYQMTNLADEAQYEETKRRLKKRLMRELRETEDPRATEEDVKFDDYPYYGGVPSWPGESTLKRYRE